MFNKVILMGRLVADPELRQTPSNISVCRFRIAVDRPYSSSNGGERQADFISIVAWRQNAEFVSKYFKKGKMAIVEGSLRNADYTDTNGVKHYAMEVQSDRVSFGESKSLSSQVNQVQSTSASVPIQNTDVTIGDLGDFEEILSGGDVPF